MVYPVSGVEDQWMSANSSVEVVQPITDNRIGVRLAICGRKC